MKRRIRFFVAVSLGICVFSGHSQAQDFTTTDGQLYVMDPAAGVEDDVTAGGVPAGHVPAFARHPVVLNFNSLPGRSWFNVTCGPKARAVVSHGILTLRSPHNCNEFILPHDNNIWHRFVDFDRGWIIEASLKVAARTEPECDDRGSVLIWANDHRKLVVIGFSTNEICITYPDQVSAPMDTTDGFHVYRIESQGSRVQIFADGRLKIDHRLSTPGGGSDVLTFGDGTVDSTSVSYWDYFSYDVFP